METMIIIIKSVTPDLKSSNNKKAGSWDLLIITDPSFDPNRDPKIQNHNNSKIGCLLCETEK